jgi:putative tryptophan/tyrosine transport system substrate-binding protein
VTGFTNIEYSLGGKWIELLKDIAPDVTRAAIVFNPDTTAGSDTYFLREIETAAASLSLQVVTAPVHNDDEIEFVIRQFAQDGGGGLITMSDIFTGAHRDRIISMAARYRLWAVYPYSIFTTSGGLISYGPSIADLFRRAALYVDRILKGEKVGELPVQTPTKFDLVINLKTAHALGMPISRELLLRANEVIE